MEPLPRVSGSINAKGCYSYFNDLTGTIFDNHKVSFGGNVLHYIKEMEVKSTNQISKELNRDYESVLRFVHEVQKVAGKHLNKLTLEGVIELDETLSSCRK